MKNQKVGRCPHCGRAEVLLVKFRKGWWCEECLCADEDDSVTAGALVARDSNLARAGEM